MTGTSTEHSTQAAPPQGSPAKRKRGRGAGPRNHRDNEVTLASKLIALGACVVLLFGVVPQVLSVMVAWRRHNTDPATALGADVGIVFAASVNADGSPSSALKGRLDVAKALYDQGKVKVVLVSGDARDSAHNEPAVMKKYLVAAGIPEAKVVEDRYGYSVYDTCARAKRVYSLNMAVLITQNYQLNRAVSTCTLAGINGAYGVGDTTMKSTDTAGWWAGWFGEIPARIGMVYDYVTDGNVVVSDVPNRDLDKALAG